MKVKTLLGLSLIVLVTSLSPAAHAQRGGSTSSNDCGKSAQELPVDWPQFHFDPCHTGYNPYETLLSRGNVGHLFVDWQYKTDTSASSPAVVNGIVYAGSIENDGNVYALNASTGAKLWSYATGGGVEGSPAVANGVVYVGSYNRNVYALDASTGDKLWSYATGNQIRSTPAVADGGLCGSNDNNLYALNAVTGVKLWSYTTGPVLSAPAVANGVVSSVLGTRTCMR